VAAFIWWMAKATAYLAGRAERYWATFPPWSVWPRHNEFQLPSSLSATALEEKVDYQPLYR